MPNIVSMNYSIDGTRTVGYFSVQGITFLSVTVYFWSGDIMKHMFLSELNAYLTFINKSVGSLILKPTTSSEK